MAAPRKTAAKTTAPKAKASAKKEEDQTPEEALVAKAEMDKHEGIESDQTPEEAEATAEIAETFEAVPENDPKNEVEAVPADSQKGENQVKVLRTGFFTGGSVRRAGEIVTVHESTYNQTDEEQIASYGEILFEKI